MKTIAAEQTLPPRFRLAQTTVKRPGEETKHATLWEALNTFRPWVGFGEAVRIVEKTFHI